MYPTQPSRSHALDNLRCVMMLLGIVFHSALSYATYTLSVRWGYRDIFNSYFLSGVTLLIHMFRMQVYFVIAGFFASLLFYRRGMKGMLANRFTRILKPLVVGLPLLFPLSILGAAFPVLGGIKGVSSTIDQFKSGKLLAKYDMTFSDLVAQYGLVHLWFLYYLMIFYIVAVSITWIIRHMSERNRCVIKRNFSRLIQGNKGLFIFAAVTALCMFFMPRATFSTAGFENTATILPHFPVLAGYFIFFAFGWMLFIRKNSLQAFKRKVLLKLICGVFLTAIYATLILNKKYLSSHIIEVSFASVATCLLVWGVAGFFLRYADKPNAIMRYLSDASYWVYLIHFPLTAFLPGLFVDVNMPALTKFFAVTALTSFISLATYHYLVRATFVGKSLGGRRLVVNENTEEQQLGAAITANQL